MDNLEKRLDFSVKLMKMGTALMGEGAKAKDINIISIGNVLTLCGGIILDDKDCHEFNNLCSMFTAKNILSAMRKEDKLDDVLSLDAKTMGDIDDLINKMKNDFNKDDDNEEVN